MDDTIRPLDVQTVGVLYLDARKNDRDAESVAASILSGYLLSGRSIPLSSAAETYNATYSAAGPFAGFRPYADAGSPDVIWAEGTRQARLAFAHLGGDVSTLDADTARWATVAPSDGPLQADRTVTGTRSTSTTSGPHPRPPAGPCSRPRPEEIPRALRLSVRRAPAGHKSSKAPPRR